jgi:cbb3-type cytochrome c oxidase subunit III
MKSGGSDTLAVQSINQKKGTCFIVRMKSYRATRFVGSMLVAAFCLTLSVAAFDDSAANDKGKSAFKTNCIACHGADGAGTTLGKSMKAPDLRTDEIQKKPEAELTDAINEGKGNMPGFKSRLTPEQVTALIAYVHELGKAKAPAGK